MKDPGLWLQKKRSLGRLERVWSQSDVLIVNSDIDSLMSYLSPGGPLWEMQAMIHPLLCHLVIQWNNVVE